MSLESKLELGTEEWRKFHRETANLISGIFRNQELESNNPTWRAEFTKYLVSELDSNDATVSTSLSGIMGKRNKINGMNYGPISPINTMPHPKRGKFDATYIQRLTKMLAAINVSEDSEVINRLQQLYGKCFEYPPTLKREFTPEVLTYDIQPGTKEWDDLYKETTAMITEELRPIENESGDNWRSELSNSLVDKLGLSTGVIMEKIYFMLGSHKNTSKKKKHQFTNYSAVLQKPHIQYTADHKRSLEIVLNILNHSNLKKSKAKTINQNLKKLYTPFFEEIIKDWRGLYQETANSIIKEIRLRETESFNPKWRNELAEFLTEDLEIKDKNLQITLSKFIGSIKPTSWGEYTIPTISSFMPTINRDGLFNLKNNQYGRSSLIKVERLSKILSAIEIPEDSEIISNLNKLYGSFFEYTSISKEKSKRFQPKIFKYSIKPGSEEWEDTYKQTMSLFTKELRVIENNSSKNWRKDFTKELEESTSLTYEPIQFKLTALIGGKPKFKGSDHSNPSYGIVLPRPNIRYKADHQRNIEIVSGILQNSEIPEENKKLIESNLQKLYTPFFQK